MQRSRRVRCWFGLMLSAVLAGSFGCTPGGEDAAGTREQAVESVPPEPAPPPAGTEGPALPPQPPSAEYLAKRAAYEAALGERMTAWDALGISEDEVKAKRRKLKDDMLRPKPDLLGGLW